MKVTISVKVDGRDSFQKDFDLTVAILETMKDSENMPDLAVASPMISFARVAIPGNQIILLNLLGYLSLD